MPHHVTKNASHIVGEVGLLVTSTKVLAHMRVSVTAVLWLVGCILGDGHNDNDLFDSNLVDNTSGSVCCGRHNLSVGVNILLGGSRSRCDGGRSRWYLDLGCLRCLILRGWCRRLGLRSVDIILRDTSGSLAPGRCVALCGHRGDAGEDRLSSGLGWATWLEWVGVSGAVLNRNVSAESLRGAGAVVLRENSRHFLNITLVLLCFGLEFAAEVLAIFGTA